MTSQTKFARIFVSGLFIPMTICFVASAAQAGEIVVSTHSSDSTPAEDLDARLHFTVQGSTLELLVANLTDGPDSGSDDGFDINEIYFNAHPTVQDLTLLTPTSGWTLLRDQHPNGFGVFDFALIDGVGDDPNQIEGETSLTFTFTITGSSVSQSDFVTKLSEPPPGDTAALGAAKFVNGPNDDSAFGATIPEPTALSLLTLGAPLLLLRRRWGATNG